MSSTEFSRLPNDIVPIHYDLELKPNLADFTFTGRVIIDIKVRLKQKTNKKSSIYPPLKLDLNPRSIKTLIEFCWTAPSWNSTRRPLSSPMASRWTALKFNSTKRTNLAQSCSARHSTLAPLSCISTTLVC